MNFTIEKTERYALLRIAEATLDGDMPATLETLCRNLFREGYSNIIIDIEPVQTVDTAGVTALRRVNRQCTSEEGLLILVTDNDDLIELLDSASGSDLTFLPTVEEAIDAVFMNELENDFRSEDDDEYNAGMDRD